MFRPAGGYGLLNVLLYGRDARRKLVAPHATTRSLPLLRLLDRRCDRDFQWLRPVVRW